MLRIVVLSDIHYSGPADGEENERNLSDIFLQRAAHRLNRLIKPDVTVLLGDLVDDGTVPGAADRMLRVQKIAGVIESPIIIMPGNHDTGGGADCQKRVETFCEIFGAPPDHLDVGDYRLLPFRDEDVPGYNARRSEADLRRMREARAGFDGKIITLQHVPVFPPGSSDCPFNHTNAEEIIAIMREVGIDVAISAHYHRGMDVRSDGMAFIAAPALVESPFRFLEVVIDGEDVKVITHQLRLPVPGLVDLHIHTNFAYCSGVLTIPRTMKLAEIFGLEKFLVAEHSGQLLFDADTYWPGKYMEEGSSYAKGVVDRTAEYLAAADAAGLPPVQAGFEVDCDYQGRQVISPLAPEDRIRIGSMHILRSLRDDAPDINAACDDFLSTAQNLLGTGIRMLTHPFRIFRRRNLDIPDRLFAPLVRMLREAGVAAEINTHGNYPPPEFFRMCIEAGVRIGLGTDSHAFWEVGELAPHLALFESLGFDGDLNDILYVPDELRQ